MTTSSTQYQPGFLARLRYAFWQVLFSKSMRGGYVLCAIVGIVNAWMLGSWIPLAAAGALAVVATLFWTVVFSRSDAARTGAPREGGRTTAGG